MLLAADEVEADFDALENRGDLGYRAGYGSADFGAGIFQHFESAG